VERKPVKVLFYYVYGCKVGGNVATGIQIKENFNEKFDQNFIEKFDRNFIEKFDQAI